MKRLYYFVICCLLLATACNQEETEMVDQDATAACRFFEYDDDGDPFKKEVVGFLEQLNDSIEFAAGFVQTMGVPVWHLGITHHYADGVGMLVPVFDQKSRCISSLYSFKYQQGRLRYKLVMNDTSDPSYKVSKRIIQYFERELGIAVSNTDFSITTKEVASMDNSLLKLDEYVITVVYYTWQQQTEWGVQNMSETSVYVVRQIGFGPRGSGLGSPDELYDGEGSMDYTGGSSGGSSSNGAVGLFSRLTPKDKMNLLMDTSNLPPDVLEALETAMEFVNNDCVGNFVLNSLIVSGFNINVAHKSDLEYPGTYNATTNTLTLPDVLGGYGTSMLIHEMFHALQDVLYPPEVIKEATEKGMRIGKVQLELEAHIITDLNEQHSKNKHFSYEKNVRDNYDKLIDNLNDKKSVQSEDFNRLLGPFQDYAPEYNTPVNLNFEPTLFKQARSNC